MQIVNKHKVRAKKKGRVVKLLKPNGKTKKIKLHKYVPKHCSAARRVCVVCMKNVIHKLSANYDSKICKDCTK